MARESKIDKAIRETYELLYEASTPKGNFTEMVDNAFIIDDNDNFLSTAEDWNSDTHYGKWRKRIIFDAYYLDRYKFHNIVEQQKKKYRLGKDFDWIYLGAGPTYICEWASKEDEEKFNALSEKIERGDVITLEDLPESRYEGEWRIKNSTERKLDSKNVHVLYEYNRFHHPEIAKEYLEKIKTKDFE